MILMDKDIVLRLKEEDPLRRIIIDPLPEIIQPASVDLSLASKLKMLDDGLNVLSVDRNPRYRDIEIDDDGYRLMPGCFVLGSTQERIEVPHDVVARVEGKSSLGRLGLMVHVTAGFIDPGFRGNITLELKNLNTSPILLTVGMLISQLCFQSGIGFADKVYGSPGLGSKYQDSEGTVGVRSHGV